MYHILKLGTGVLGSLRGETKRCKGEPRTSCGYISVHLKISEHKQRGLGGGGLKYQRKKARVKSTPGMKSHEPAAFNEGGTMGEDYKKKNSLTT